MIKKIRIIFHPLLNDFVEILQTLKPGIVDKLKKIITESVTA